jgi:hypothetical protein
MTTRPSRGDRYALSALRKQPATLAAEIVHIESNLRHRKQMPATDHPVLCLAMDPNTTALERAFQLAKSGAFTSVHAIKQQLSAEGFAAAQVTGKSLAKQLNALIKAAREGTHI